MFIGHIAVGLAAKRAAPPTGLGILMAAPLLLDLIWPFFLLTGLEVVRIDPGNTRFTPLDFVSYPYTHSLLAACVWALLFAAIFRGRAAVVLALAVFSHWVLDFVTHRPDMPLWPGGETRYGLGLWNSIPATFAVELVLFAAGIWLYASSTRARDRSGRIGLWSFVVFILLIYAANQFGPPPPDETALAWTALLMWSFVLWAWWFDRHRERIR